MPQRLYFHKDPIKLRVNRAGWNNVPRPAWPGLNYGFVKYG
ncbi:hypothetical protein FAES_2246 [Fibrella aestuarina BUZ 2]|uniref:Uncharacterized protein n=1 Tax=Fibrella aestuarina BUZ 2 TaxID=1166018 RepID=I0K802_9BACT|nr:hypothetical protein FAES_2246 [Fibrella aestuarina BUZ 2]